MGKVKRTSGAKDMLFLLFGPLLLIGAIGLATSFLSFPLIQFIQQLWNKL